MSGEYITASVEEARHEVDSRLQIIDCFLDKLRALEFEEFFDVLGLSLAIKERATFDDVKVLVDHQRHSGAQARLRSIWESLVILKHAVYCSPDREAYAKALFLHDGYRRANVLKANGLWDTLADEQKRPMEEATTEYRGLPQDLRSLVELSLEQKHLGITRNSSGGLPSLSMHSVEVSQYDAVFRTFSMEAHGGVPGSNRHVREWLGQETQSAPAGLEIAGPLLAGCSWLLNLIEEWVAVTSHRQVVDSWRRCQEGDR